MILSHKKLIRKDKMLKQVQHDKFKNIVVALNSFQGLLSTF